MTCQQGLTENFGKILTSEVVKFLGLSPLDFQKPGEGERVLCMLKEIPASLLSKRIPIIC